MFLTILQHIPTWVFFVFVGLVALGVSQSFTRSVRLRRTIFLPLGLMAWSLQSVLSSFGQHPWALLAWAGGVVMALAALHERFDTSDVRYDAQTQRFTLPGSWLPLALMMTLFALKFGVGMSLAMQPALAQSTGFALGMSACWGAFSGVFLARSVAWWQVARRSGLPSMTTLA